ncbi:MAG: class IV adenylate cyclase [Desulfobacterales bacterium]|jgi:adenylate cyclase class 2|nr:class IV adenylate cyclase [Desulfobacterales bacterium]
MDSLEIEVKFFLPDLNSVRESLIKLGARSLGRFFEVNIRFEDRDKSLIKKNALLRLRKDNRVTLTYKSEPELDDLNFKIFRELEVEVSDFGVMESILNSLGFCAEQVYEKWRETLVLQNTHFCLDTMPFGTFLEIEGNRENIPDMARKLGLEWEDRILFNYLKIFDVLKRQENINFSDVTFENFKHLSFDFSEHLLFFTRKGN